MLNINNIIKSEFYKLKKSKSIYIVLVVSAVFAIIVAFAHQAGSQMEAAANNQNSKLIEMASDFSGTWLMKETLNEGILPLLIAILTSIFISADFNFGTMKNIVSKEFLGFEGIQIMRIPSQWYRNGLTTYLGFPMSDFVSTDYFPLLPWFFLFLTGYFLFRLVEQKKLLPLLKKGKCVAVEKMGEKSLMIYLLHQPILYAGLSIFFRIREFQI